MNKGKILIVDGQLFQTAAWHRGMGKYMLQVLKQLSEQYDDSRKIIIFNEQLGPFDNRRADIDYHCPNFEQIVISLPLAKDRHSSARQYRRTLNQSIEQLVGKDTELTFLLTSIFTFDFYAEYPRRADYKALIFYDLIPLLQWKDLGGYFPPHLYMERFNKVYETDLIFCISETTRQDVISTFSIDPRKAANIDGGYTEHHLPPVRPKKIEVPEHYILFPTGNLPHKNNQVVFEAFKDVLKVRKDVHLVITSKFEDEAIKKLTKICSNNVIFTQNVDDEELQYLYHNADLVIFASKYEGLGLPVLDAVHHVKPVVASRVSVFEEMSKNAFFYFEVDNPMAATEAILSALDTKKVKLLEKHYGPILKKYTWERVGKELIAQLQKLSGAKNKHHNHDVYDFGHKRIAIVSANPGIEGSIGRLAERLYAHLRDDYRISYFFDGCGLGHVELERPTFLDHLEGPEVFDISRLTTGMYERFDEVFYLVDNHILHFMMMQNVACLPGTIVADPRLDSSNVVYRAATTESLGVIKGSNETYEQVKHIADQMSSIINTGAPDTETQRVIKGRGSNKAKRRYLLRKARN